MDFKIIKIQTNSRLLDKSFFSQNASLKSFIDQGDVGSNADLFVFQMWTVSGSSMPCFSAMSSRKSKKNLTAMGGGRFVLSMATKTSSTNFCRVPWRYTFINRAAFNHTDSQQQKTDLKQTWEAAGSVWCVCVCAVLKMTQSQTSHVLSLKAVV